MKIKRLITLIESLALTGLVSVGFSSWLIVVESQPKDIGINVNVEEVVDNSSYLEIDKLLFSDYNSSGFYTNDELGSSNSLNPGILEFDIIINLNNYRVDYGITTSFIKLGIMLGYTKSVTQNNFGLDIISRSLHGENNETGGIESDYTIYYDGVIKNSGESYDVDESISPVYYTEDTPAPNVYREISFNSAASVNQIIVKATYEFSLYGGWKNTDWQDIYQLGIPFYIHTTLEEV